MKRWFILPMVAMLLAGATPRASAADAPASAAAETAPAPPSTTARLLALQRASRPSTAPAMSGEEATILMCGYLGGLGPGAAKPAGGGAPVGASPDHAP